MGQVTTEHAQPAVHTATRGLRGTRLEVCCQLRRRSGWANRVERDLERAKGAGGHAGGQRAAYSSNDEEKRPNPRERTLTRLVPLAAHRLRLHGAEGGRRLQGPRHLGQGHPPARQVGYGPRPVPPQPPAQGLRPVRPHRELLGSAIASARPHSGTTR